MQETYCQCCGMLMNEPEKFGTEADGRRNEEYCCHCWVDGAFADWCKDMTVDEMIEDNIRFVMEAQAASTESEAREMLRESMPKLRRWSVS